MSLPESRRDSAEVENFRENNMMYKTNGQQQQHFKREEFLDTFNSQPKVGILSFDRVPLPFEISRISQLNYVTDINK